MNAFQSSLSANTQVMLDLPERLRPIVEQEIEKSLHRSLHRVANSMFANALQGASAAVACDTRNTVPQQPARTRIITTANTTPPPLFPTTTATVTPATNNYPGFNYKLPTQIDSASDLWNCWYGLGEHLDKPIPGGIPQLCEQKGNKWRGRYDNNEKRMFSRWKMSIQLMNEEKGNRTDHIVFLSEMDVLYNKSKKRKISPFYDLLASRKKKRIRRSVRFSEAATELT
jgi:hypothetical protein